MFDVTHAIGGINDWNCHLLRSVNQEQAKQEILSALNNDSLYHSFSVISVMKGYTVETFVHLFDS